MLDDVKAVGSLQRLQRFSLSLSLSRRKWLQRFAGKTSAQLASGAEMDVCGTGGLCDVAREDGGGGWSQQQPHSASLRLLRKRALLHAGWVAGRD